jgi:hypothetical protein
VNTLRIARRVNVKWKPHHEDIVKVLERYETTKDANETYRFIGEELGCRGYYEKPLKTFSQEVRVFILIWCADGMINNGGIASFFFNGYGQQAEETVAALKTVGAPIKANAIEKAMQSFPKGKYPKTPKEYDKILEKHEEELKFLDEVDSPYFNSPENIEELVVRFVKSNYEKFAP